MPRHVEPGQDPITPMARFRTSSLFQLLVSLQSVTHPWRHKEWTELVTNSLGKEYYDELRGLYDGFHNGCDFAEMAIDYQDYHDVPGFIDFVENLPVPTFAFYVLGRIYRLEEIPRPVSGKSIFELVKRHHNLESFQHTGMTFDWADDVPGLQKKLARLWRTYWERFFRERLKEHESAWERSIQEKEEILYRQGGTVLLEQLTGCQKLPAAIPEDQPITTVQFIPARLMPRRHHMYYGYGMVSVVYDCTRSEREKVEIEQAKESALSVLRALGDENRLKILKLISDEERAYNGRKIAEKLRLSPSVVSRHLGQLKEAGLIEEYSPDNRNILYNLRREKLTGLTDLLFRYIND